MISTKQFEIMTAMGPDNPIVGLKEARDTLAEMIELRGKKDSTRYFKPITEAQLKAMAEAKAQQPPPETPEMVLAKAQIETTKMKVEADIANQQQKAQRDLMIKQAEMSMEWQKIQMQHQLEREKVGLVDDRERDKQASEIQLDVQKMELEHVTDINEAHLSADIERERDTTQAAPGEENAAPAPRPRARRRNRRVSFHRDAHGRLAGATVEDDEGE
jgi:hypothetical protein